ncbi:hypothetical protein SELMODRAFT_439262 [Selaginella moellendorffii]|uniref:Uncharacterized protein n=1 Tax=Selaginella moellendorffii TaxID=88036 RepID=D8R364_SELML|nr:hypothetical protein SELMODRAFT_439262 [Selaginella moellendorffii]
MAESEAQRSAWESAQRLKISVDLVDAAKEELEFLALVDRIPRLYEGEALNQAIHRYTSFWLPFAAAYDQNDGAKLPLVPPLDCAWVWHCHRLSPVRYAQDCKALFGKIVDAPLASPQSNDAATIETQKLWSARFPDEPFNLDVNYKSSHSSSIPEEEGRKKLAQYLEGAVRLAVLSARNVPAEKSSSTFVSLSTFANFLTQTPEVATASPNPQWDKLWLLECDAAAGGLVLELRQRRKGFLGLSKGSKLLGALTITWKMILETSTLSLNGWFPLFTPDGVTTDKVPSLRVEVSVTPPVRAPYVMKVTKPELRGGKHLAKVLDHTNKDVFHVHTSFSSGVRSITVAATHNAGHKLVLLAVAETPNLWQWSLDGDCTIVIGRNAEYEVHFGACGDGCPVTLVAGRKLQFALAGTKDVNEGFVTLIRYLPKAPNGKATALFNWKTGYMEVTVEENTMLVAALLCATATSMACLSLDNQKPVTKSLTSRSYRVPDVGVAAMGTAEVKQDQDHHTILKEELVDPGVEVPVAVEVAVDHRFQKPVLMTPKEELVDLAVEVAVAAVVAVDHHFQRMTPREELVDPGVEAAVAAVVAVDHHFQRMTPREELVDPDVEVAVAAVVAVDHHFQTPELMTPKEELVDPAAVVAVDPHFSKPRITTSLDLRFLMDHDQHIQMQTG